MGLLDKKFKVRVSHFAECKYTVQYAYYRFIPIWYSLCFWFEQGHPGGTECWSTYMWDLKTAERIASSLKSINDVREYYKPCKEQKETQQPTKPVESVQKPRVIPTVHSKETEQLNEGVDTKK